MSVDLYEKFAKLGWWCSIMVFFEKEQSLTLVATYVKNINCDDIIIV